jgi:hypothetical protein
LLELGLRPYNATLNGTDAAPPPDENPEKEIVHVVTSAAVPPAASPISLIEPEKPELSEVRKPGRAEL